MLPSIRKYGRNAFVIFIRYVLRLCIPVVDIIFNLGNIHKINNEWEKALNCLEEVHRIRVIHYGMNEVGVGAVNLIKGDVISF
mmetsp:Transcript_9422/g.9536  ORF Transcript_9422/g.9536 Transcript_9422/m.9536 type:complete len:83 (+) Transcript_9422:465-713(+)